MSTSPLLAFPPLDCSLIFPDLISFHMRKNPSSPMFVYADAQSPEDTTKITFLEFGRAVHRVAHVLRPNRDGDEGQVVMLIANCDTLLYHTLSTGMSVAGLVPFLVSPRNAPAAVVDMMKKTNCSRIVTLHHAHHALIDAVRDASPDVQLTIEEAPTLSYAFPKLGNEVEDDPFSPYPPAVSRPDLNQPAIYVHSSGSTCFPKAIPHTHKIQIQLMAQPIIQDLCHIPAPRRVGAMALPAFHMYGMAVQLYLPIACLVTTVIYPPQARSDPDAVPVIPTADNILDFVRRTKCKVLMVVPTFLEQWSISEAAVDELKRLDIIVYGGGALSEKIGDALCASGVPLGAGYGGSEFGFPVALFSIKDARVGDWMYLRFVDSHKVRWASQGDGTYELQVLTADNNQMAVENLPDVKGFATSDLFVKHPTKDLWKIVGRLDDVIVLASGEKTVPTPMENMIGSGPLLRGAVMFGRGRNQVGILVEPRPEHVVDIRDDHAIAEFRNKIWLDIEEANTISPAFSRIFKEMILIADPEKPIPRTPKGTIQKKVVLKSYEAQIDALYDTLEAQSHNGLAGPPSWTAEVIAVWLTEIVRTITRGHDIDTRSDLFAQGFDSLSVTYLRNQLLNALRKAPETEIAVRQISLKFIFENPTIELLASRIAEIVEADSTSLDLDSEEYHITAMNAMVEKYSIRLHDSATTVTMTNATSHGLVVLLTGSTGSLGSFLLSRLLENPDVIKVYALNRPSSASIKDRQMSAFLDKALPINLLSSGRLVYVEADASQDKCGLSPTLYEEIKSSVTNIIHNAWRLDFNLSLASFVPNVKATRNLLDLALSSQHRHSLHFVFTSSVGTAQSWDHKRGPFPEKLQLDPSVAVGTGYGEAKYVCERIIASSGLHSTSLRIGQITGGPNGSWSTTDWVPIIVKSSISIGAFPDSRGICHTNYQIWRAVSWMRAEEVAESVLDIAFTNDAPRVLNIVNPQLAPWASIMRSIRDEILNQKSLQSDQLAIVPFKEWVARLEQRAEGATSEDLINIPAIKLLDFFRIMAHKDELDQPGLGSVKEVFGMGDFDTTTSQRVSKTVSQMRAIRDLDARGWVLYWISKGFL